MAALIQHEMVKLHVDLKKEQIRFQSKTANLSSERMKNKRLLFLFQRDLLPGLQGEILEIKDKRDNLSGSFFSEGVSLRAKIASWAFLGLLDVGMLFYVFLFAVSQDSHRQAAWGRSFAVWLVFEVVLISSVFCLVIHVLLPSLLMKNLFQVKKKLVESLQRYHQSLRSDLLEEEPTTSLKKSLDKHENDQDNDDDDDDTLIDDHQEEEEDDEEDEEDLSNLHQPAKPSALRRLTKNQKKPAQAQAMGQGSASLVQSSFNAARYLFLSHRLASLHRELKVARIILQFQSPYPKQSYQYVNDISKKYNKKFAAFIRSGSVVLVFLLTNFLSVPIALQDLFVQVFVTGLLGYLIYLHLLLFQVFPGLVVLPALLLVAIVVVVLRQIALVQQRQQKKKKQPLNPSPANPSPINPSAMVAAVAPVQTHVTRRASLQHGLGLVGEMHSALDQPAQAEEKRNSPDPGHRRQRRTTRRTTAIRGTTRRTIVAEAKNSGGDRLPVPGEEDRLSEDFLEDGEEELVDLDDDDDVLDQLSFGSNFLEDNDEEDDEDFAWLSQDKPGAVEQEEEEEEGAYRLHFRDDDNDEDRAMGREDERSDDLSLLFLDSSLQDDRDGFTRSPEPAEQVDPPRRHRPSFL